MGYSSTKYAVLDVFCLKRSNKKDRTHGTVFFWGLEFILKEHGDAMIVSIFAKLPLILPRNFGIDGRLIAKS